MSLESDVNLLGQVPLLAEFGDERLRLLAFSAENERLEDGEELFLADEPADSAYVVTFGKVGLFLPQHPGRIIDECGTGQIIDERSLIVEGQRLTSAIALGDCEVIRIRRALFRRMLSEYPDMAARLKPHFAARLLSLSQSLEHVRKRLENLD